MTQTKFSQFFAIIVITLLVSSCASPAAIPASPTATIIPTPASTPTLDEDIQLANQIDNALATLARRDLFSGSVLVAKGGRLLLSQGYGKANIELDVPNTPQTKFRIGSLTKQFTAMAILQLQQRGLLNVQDPICNYIDNCPETWQPITIHHLLTHTSGIYDLTKSADYPNFKKQPMSPTQIIDRFRNLPLDFTPGEKFSYSNSGYILLGYIIEKVSGQPYATFLQENIFGPLQMKDTGYDDPNAKIENRAAGYTYSTTESIYIAADYIDMSVPFAAGGLYSTVEDLYLWDQALYSEKLLPAGFRDEVFTPFVQIPYSYLSYGYGWLIGKQFDQPWIWHTGGIDGFVSMINRFPESKVTIILLSNHQNSDVNGITATIALMIFGGSWIAPTY